jgi:hypothetical protein
MIINRNLNIDYLNIIWNHSICGPSASSFSWLWLALDASGCRKEIHSSHSDCYSSRSIAAAVHPIHSKSHGDDRFGDRLRNLGAVNREYWCCLTRASSTLDDSPLTQIPYAPRNRTRIKFYYHTNKIYHPRRTWNEIGFGFYFHIFWFIWIIWIIFCNFELFKFLNFDLTVFQHVFFSLGGWVLGKFWYTRYTFPKNVTHLTKIKMCYLGKCWSFRPLSNPWKHEALWSRKIMATPIKSLQFHGF